MGGIGFDIVKFAAWLVAFFAAIFIVTLPITLGLWTIVWFVLRAARPRKLKTSVTVKHIIAVAFLCLLTFGIEFYWINLSMRWEAAVLYAAVLCAPLTFFSIVVLCDARLQITQSLCVILSVMLLTAFTITLLKVLQNFIGSEAHVVGLLGFMPVQGCLAVLASVCVLIFARRCEMKAI